MRKIIKTQSGFSLLEIMVATAVMGVLSLGFMKLTQNGIEGGKRVEVNSQTNEMKNEILGLLSDRENCSRTFLGTPNFSGVVGGGVKALPSIIDKNGNARFTAGQTYPGGVKLKSMEVKDYNSATQKAGLFLNYDYNLNSQIISNKTRRIDLQLELDGSNALTGCVAMAGVQNVDAKQLCDNVVGYDANGNSYFAPGGCRFDVASCEKSGGIWNATAEKCGQSPEQKYTEKLNACQNSGGYLRLPTKAANFSDYGGVTYQNCSVADISAGKECICRSTFTHGVWLTNSAPTVLSASTAEQVKPIILNINKFTMVSRTFTIGNPFPDGNPRARRVKITATIGVENWASDSKEKWITGEVGCIRNNLVAIHAEEANTPNWIPNSASTQGNSVYTGGPGFSIWHGTNSLRQTQPGMALPNLNVDIYNREFRMGIVRDGMHQPGDRCAIMLYINSSTPGEVRVTTQSVQMEHFGDDSSYGANNF